VLAPSKTLSRRRRLDLSCARLNKRLLRRTCPKQLPEYCFRSLREAEGVSEKQKEIEDATIEVTNTLDEKAVL